MSAKTKSEMSDIFTEEKIEKYVVKPWTITQFVKLTPILKQVAGALKEQGIDFSQTDLEKIDLNMNLTASEIFDYLTKIIDVVGPVVPTFLSVSLRIELEEAENIEWGIALAIMAKIVIFNWDHIKNWLGQILGKDPKTLVLALQKKKPI